MGGVICCRAAIELQNDTPLACVIAIAAPLKGTEWAGVAVGPTREAGRRRNDGINTHELRVQLHTIVAKNDIVVTAESAAPAGCIRHAVRGGHGLVTLQRETVDLVGDIVSTSLRPHNSKSVQ